jgi:hypothetical protein
MTMDEFKSEVRNKLESQFTQFKNELESLKYRRMKLVIKLKKV